MNKMMLMIFLGLSLQGCITTSNDSGSDIPSIVNDLPKAEEKNGLRAMSEFMAMMAVIKAPTE